MAEPFKDYDKIFKEGTRVEVSSTEEGLRGSWYTATVLRPISYARKTIFIQFEHLIGNERKPYRLRESVDAVLVRPIAPRETRRSFKIDEDVDAWDQDGWWEGVVINVLKGSRYEVYFRCSREQLIFHEHELRLHREWVNGNWVPPLEPVQAPSTPSKEKKPAVRDEPPLTRSRKRKVEKAGSDKMCRMIKNLTDCELFKAAAGGRLTILIQQKFICCKFWSELVK
ncbi:hypothetical protein Dimus_016710 [Dionaea muscipula]